MPIYLTIVANVNGQQNSPLVWVFYQDLVDDLCWYAHYQCGKMLSEWVELRIPLKALNYSTNY